MKRELTRRLDGQRVMLIVSRTGGAPRTAAPRMLHTANQGAFPFHILTFDVLTFHILTFHILTFHILTFHILTFHASRFTRNDTRDGPGCDVSAKSVKPAASISSRYWSTVRSRAAMVGIITLTVCPSCQASRSLGVA